jgi:hypothetical protein
MRGEGRGHKLVITSIRCEYWFFPHPCLEKVLYLSGRVPRPVGETLNVPHFSLTPHPLRPMKE